jgi:hypothetical protein
MHGASLSLPFFPEDGYVLNLTCGLLGSNFVNPLRKYLLFQLQRLEHSDPLTLSASMCIAQKMDLTTPYPIISVGYGRLQRRNKGVKTPGGAILVHGRDIYDSMFGNAKLEVDLETCAWMCCTNDLPTDLEASRFFLED